MAESGKLLTLPGRGYEPPLGRIVKPSAPRHSQRKKLAGLTPEGIASIIERAESGDTEDLADVAAKMIRDPHVRATYETRTLAIVGAEIVVEPGRVERVQDEPMAEAAAEFFRRELDACDDLPGLLSALIHAEGVGWAGAEHFWQRTNGEWHSSPKPLQPRDIRFDSLWHPEVRSYDGGQGAGRWLSTVGENPARWMFHVPQKLDRPTVGGDLVACAWAWIFKQWMILFRQEGLEKYGGPFLKGEVPENAPQAVMDELRTSLESMSADQVGVFKQGSTISFLETAKPGGEVWSDAIDHLNAEITKALLGSTLNTEVGSTGGNRSLGESQANVTILPRLQTMARRLSATLRRDWAEPCLRFNAHKFGGMVPALPSISFQLTQEEKPSVDELAVKASVVTKDELRISRGLEPLGPTTGGDDIVTLPEAQPAYPGFGRDVALTDAPGGAPAARPLGRDVRQKQSVARLTRRVPFAYSASQRSSQTRGPR